MELKDRLALLMRQQGINSNQLAKKLGTTRQSVAFWLIGRNNPAFETTEKIADYFGVSGSWLRTGNGEMTFGKVTSQTDTHDNLISIPEYRLEFSCGTGDDSPTWIENPTESATYRDFFFIKRSIKPENCKRVLADGDSMEPLICDGDHVMFVETKEGTPIRDGKIYAIGYGGALRIKRLYRKANGDIIIRSENKAYPDETISASDAEHILKIFGIVIERSGSL